MRSVDLAVGTIQRIEFPNAYTRKVSRSRHELEPFDIVCLPGGSELLLTYLDNSFVCRVHAKTSVIATVAGTGEPGYTGDGGPATAARLNSPVAAVADRRGHVFIADSNSFVVRRVDAKTGVISTFAGTGEPGYTGDGGPATAARLNELGGLAFNHADDLFIADLENCVVRRVDAKTGVISTFAGTGEPGYTGDGGPATAARLKYPATLAVDPQGDILIADSQNCVVRRVDEKTGVITTVAGIGQPGYTGDGGPATAARLNKLGGLGYNDAGDMFIADLENCVIRRVDEKTGLISTIAGTGEPGYTGDGGPAILARLNYPLTVTVNDGTLYVAEARIRTSKHKR